MPVPYSSLYKREAHELPSALEAGNSLQDKLKGKTPAVFLDYDGCLSPIVKNPEDAVLSAEMKKTLQALADRCVVAVVSGRDRHNVKDLVQLENLFYAGSHGFDISGPDNMQNEPGSAKEIVPELDKAEAELYELLQHIEGVLIERKRYAIAVHYRNVATGQEESVLKIVDQVLQKFPKLKPGPGKKIVELKPNIDWHKGKAVLWLMNELELNRPDIIPVFVGDDLTDEDAFAALQDTGITVLVGEHDEQTYANYRLENVEEVQQFLTMLTRHMTQAG